MEILFINTASGLLRYPIGELEWGSLWILFFIIPQRSKQGYGLPDGT
jgi:hypothetical protein